MFQKRQLPVAIAATCMLLTSTACDGGPEGQGSTTPSSTPSATSTPTKPTVTAPTIPPAAQSGLTVTAAEAFARFYVAVINYTEATGDAGPMRLWQQKGYCVNCTSIANTYEQTYRAGGTVTGQLGTRILSTKEARLIGKDTAVVTFDTFSGKTTWRKTAQAKPTNLPGGPADWEMTLAGVNGKWRMSEVVIKE